MTKYPQNICFDRNLWLCGPRNFMQISDFWNSSLTKLPKNCFVILCPRTSRSQHFMKTSWNQKSWNDFWIRTLISYLHSFQFHASKIIFKLCSEIRYRISKLLCILMQSLEYNFWFSANRKFGHKPAKKFTLLVLFESPMRPESFARCILGNFLYSSSKKPAMHKSFTQETS